MSPEINTESLRKRFMMVSRQLEVGVRASPDATSAEATKQSRAEAKPEAAAVLIGAVDVSWNDLVRRFVAYTRGHFFDNGKNAKDPKAAIGADTCRLILEIWTLHLVGARTVVSDKDGNILSYDISAVGSPLRHCKP
jgi:hypothetical protein